MSCRGVLASLAQVRHDLHLRSKGWMAASSPICRTDPMNGTRTVVLPEPRDDAQALPERRVQETWAFPPSRRGEKIITGGGDHHKGVHAAADSVSLRPARSISLHTGR